MSRSNSYRYWRAALATLGLIGLATAVIRIPGFWSSYVLDIVGPAWNYILLRGLFSRTQPAMLSRYLAPEAAVIAIVTACILIEVAQYLHLYEAHFDPLDFIAYVSLVVPCYTIDRWRLNRCMSDASIAK